MRANEETKSRGGARTFSRTSCHNNSPINSLAAGSRGRSQFMLFAETEVAHRQVLLRVSPWGDHVLLVRGLETMC